MNKSNEQWKSRVGLVLAMAGNAVGLGNFLRFPVKAIENGGGSFIIPYLVCFLLMGLPLLLVEWSMGKFGGKSNNHSMPFILHSMSGRWIWKYIGVFGIFTNIAVAAYYCYIESWSLNYAWHSLFGTFDGKSQEEITLLFVQNAESPGAATLFFWLFCLTLNTWILSRGLGSGIEAVAKIAMPLLILFGILLAIQGITLKAGHNGALFDGTVGLGWLWTPDFSSIWHAKVWLAAAGQIFFTLSVGMGSIQCYASYLQSQDDIALNAMSAGWMNEFVEVVLGAAIVIPIAVGYMGIDGVLNLVKYSPDIRWGLGFQTLPYLFEQWGGFLSVAAGLMWFLLLFFAGITSSLAMGMPFMSFLSDEFGFSRKQASLAFGVTILALGLPTVVWFKYGVFGEYDYWAGDVSLVIFALFEVVFFAWVFGMDKGWKAITEGADIRVPEFFRFVIQYITPVFLLIIFLGSIPDWIARLSNEAIYTQIKSTTDFAQLDFLHKKLWFVNLSRVGLAAVFAAIAGLVFMAYRKRIKNAAL